MTKVSLTSRELATILAALRYWQAQVPSREQMRAIDDISTNGGTLNRLSAEEIDDLCEAINHE